MLISTSSKVVHTYAHTHTHSFMNHSSSDSFSNVSGGTCEGFLVGELLDQRICVGVQLHKIAVLSRVVLGVHTWSAEGRSCWSVTIKYGSGFLSASQLGGKLWAESSPQIHMLKPKLEPQNVTALWDKIFKEVIKLKWGHHGWAQFQHAWCP